MTTRPRILNVGADDARRAAASGVLQQAGFAVEEAASGRAALAQLGSAPDLVVIALDLPDLDGIELTRRIRGAAETRALPVLHLSPRAGAADARTRGLEVGADGCLGLPIDPVELVAAVRSLLRTRRAERDLRRSLEQTSVILQNIADAVTAQDPSGRLIYANDAALRLLGLPSLEEAQRRDVLQDLELLDDAGRPIPVDALPSRRVLGGEPEARALVRWRRRGAPGDERFTIVQARPVRDEQGEVTMAINILHDITERRRAEQRMRVLNEATAALTASLDYEATLERIARLPVPLFGDCSVLHVIEGAEVRAVVHHQDPALAALAREAAARPHPLSDRIALPPALFTGRAELLPVVDDALVAERVHDATEAALVRRLGIASGMSAPLATRGQAPFGVLSVMSARPHHYGPEDLQLLQDVADRSALALDNARTLRRAEEASELRRDLVAVVAHDLKNPLNAISMAAALLARQAAAGPEGDRARRQASIVARAAERMNRLIHDLLDVSAIDAGRLALDRQPVRVAPLVGEAIDTFAPLAQEKRLVLEKRLPAAAELAVLGDRERILQILSNLLGNAFKFTPEGGRVTVGVEPGAAEARFFVADTGPGIAPEHLPHVFDRFWRVRKQTRDGTGLGLWIVKGLVEAHGGRVSVETAPGRGATFSFTLPRAT